MGFVASARAVMRVIRRDLGETRGVAGEREERLLNLVTLLLSGRAPTLKEVTSWIPGYSSVEESARSEFMRDKRQLAAEGFPVETVARGGNDANQFGYRILPDRYESPDFGLDEAETAAIRRALSSVDLAGDADTFALWKLGGADPLVDGGLGGLDVPAVTGDLLAAIDRAATVSFTYRGRQHEVEPLGLLVRRARWYLSGISRSDRERRTYRVDRIEADTVVVGEPGAFERPDDWDPDVVMPVDAWTMSGDDPVPVDVAIHGPLARWVEATVRSGAVVGELSDGVVVRLDVSHRDAFRSWLLSFGTDAVVLSPPAVRDDVRQWLDGVITGVAVPGAERPLMPVVEPRPLKSTPTMRWLRRTMAMLAWLADQDGPVPIAQVAERFSVNTATVESDLLRASVCGLPPFNPEDLYDVVVDDETGLVESRRTPWVSVSRAGTLSDSEVVAVSTAGQLLAQVAPPAEREVLERALAKVQARLGVSGHLRVVLDAPPHVGALRAAVASGIQVKVDYVAASSRRVSEDRLVDPLQVVLEDGRWYLDAFDHASRRRRRFRIDRVLDVEPQSTPVLGRYPREAPQQWPPADAPMVTFVVPANAGWVVETHKAEVVERAEGTMTLRLAVADWAWFATVCLQVGPGVEVLSPPEQVDLPARAATALLARYA